MAVIINGDTGIDKITDGSIVAADIGAGEITQAKLASGVAGTGPAFGAYMNANQAISTGTHTKIQINTEEFDTNSNYDHSTNYRFTPTVAGYYQLNGSFRYDAATSASRGMISIYKNGSALKRGNDIASSGGHQLMISSVVYMNGTTDYVELYAWISAGTAVIGTAGQGLVWFNGSLVRAA